MPLTMADKYSIGAFLRAVPALPNGSFTGGTAVTTGSVIDRSLYGFAGSSALIVTGAYTVASAASGDYLTVSGIINTAASLSAGALAVPSALKTFSVQVPFASNAANKAFSVVVPVSFNAAFEYVALSSLTLTPTSTSGTYSAMSANALWVLAGEYQTPDPAYVPTGFNSFSN